MAQSIEDPTVDCSSGHDLHVVGSSPTYVSTLSRKSA